MTGICPELLMDGVASFGSQEKEICALLVNSHIAHFLKLKKHCLLYFYTLAPIPDPISGLRF